MQRLAIVMMCLFLQACSNTSPVSSLWNRFFGTDGVQLSDDEIQNMPYASQYVRLNDGPQIFVVLAFSENGQHKWVTQDHATLVTQHDRLVKTVGLGDNLVEVTNLQQDPLAKVNQIVDGASWTRQASWTEHQQVRNATLRSTFHWDGKDSLEVGSDVTPVRILDEKVTTDAGSWHNRYWVDEEGYIRKTKQYLGPGYYPITTILLKAAK
ncbi:YjbF family lipoprotein [Enterobacteriaceae bacterium BIT-l23]|nr:YjbF family lipoprotein [Enterobacteriaceae bacterium BIT-l23]